MGLQRICPRNGEVISWAVLDTVGKSLELRFANVKLDWCRGSIPTPHGPLELSWKKTGDKFTYRLIPPPGYQVEVQNLTGQATARE